MVYVVYIPYSNQKVILRKNSSIITFHNEQESWTYRVGKIENDYGWLGSYIHKETYDKLRLLERRGELTPDVATAILGRTRIDFCGRMVQLGLHI